MRNSQRLRSDEPAGVAADLTQYWRDGYAIVRGFFGRGEFGGDRCGDRPASCRRRRARPLLPARQPVLQCRPRARRQRAAGADGAMAVLSPAGAQSRPAGPALRGAARAADRQRPQADHQPGPLEGAGLARRFRLAPGQPLPPARPPLTATSRHPMCRPASRSIRTRPSPAACASFRAAICGAIFDMDGIEKALGIGDDGCRACRGGPVARRTPST